MCVLASGVPTGPKLQASVVPLEMHGNNKNCCSGSSLDGWRKGQVREEKCFWACENKKREGAGGKTGVSAGTIENTEEGFWPLLCGSWYLQ